MHVSLSAEETIEFGIKVGRGLASGSVLCLKGDLGSGKTTFVKGVALGVGNIAKREVSSPTFSYLNIYSGRMPIYHFDLYRLRSAQEFCALGFDEYLQGDGISCIEWAEKIESLLPSSALTIKFAHGGENRRAIWVF